MEQYQDEGNWDLLSLRATGSVDHVAEDIFIGENYVYPILTARPQRLEAFYSVGVIGLASIGHSGWAMGISRRALDELAALARAKTGRAGMIGESEHSGSSSHATRQGCAPPGLSCSRHGGTSRRPWKAGSPPRHDRYRCSICPRSRCTPPAPTRSVSRTGRGAKRAAAWHSPAHVPRDVHRHATHHGLERRDGQCRARPSRRRRRLCLTIPRSEAGRGQKCGQLAPPWRSAPRWHGP